VNFVIDKSVKSVPVTVNVSEVPWNVALDSILRSQELGVQVNGTILRVADAKALATEGELYRAQMDNQLDGSPLYTEFIRLNYARAAGTIGRGSPTSGTTTVGGQSGGSGDDHLDGGDGDDELDGGEGSNWLDGGAGNDWLIIFSGKDTIVLQPGFGNDVVEGFGGHGKDGFDMIDVTAYHFQDFMLGTDILVLSLGDDTVLTIGTDTLTLLNTKSGDVSSSDFIYH